MNSMECIRSGPVICVRSSKDFKLPERIKRHRKKYLLGNKYCNSSAPKLDS